MKLSSHKVYEQDIQPLIDRIVLICEQENIPMHTLFQLGNDRIESSYLSFGNDNKILKLALMLIEAGNIDLFLDELIKEAEIKGHSSLYLKAMGIPESPTVLPDSVNNIASKKKEINLPDEIVTSKPYISDSEDDFKEQQSNKDILLSLVRNESKNQ